MKKRTIFLIIIISAILLGCTKTEEKKISIITTNFPSYDFTRAITKYNKDIKLEMLVSPGEEVHTFEPTPKDIINIQNSDIFIYTGGESDEWVNSIIKEAKNTKIIKLMDLVELKKEETVEGMESDEEDDEYDEHVWTSLKNAVQIIKGIEKTIESIDESNRELYSKNAEEYIEQINNIDKKIQNIIDNSKRKELIFGDRFPFRYFIDDYNLKYYAAFKGCSEETEASAKTLKFMIDKVKEYKIPVVLKIELSNGLVANQISKETNTKVLELSSAHNISKKDYNDGKTYIDIMNQNARVIKEALN